MTYNDPKGLNLPIHRGEAAPAAKLTERKVRTIRRLAAEGVSYAKLAKRYGVGQTTIRKVVMRHSWRHVE